MRTWKALCLENEWVKLCVLPEVGGRLFYAIDKTNGYDIFYRQDAIKPANVGMNGAWISGGVEWNVFHHHRISTQMPCDYRLVENADGSKTIDGVRVVFEPGKVRETKCLPGRKATMVLGDERRRVALERGKVYNVRKGVWHQIETSADGKVLVVENDDISRANSEYRSL